MLFLTAWREGHHFGGHLPMLMIAHCIGNRVRQGWGEWLDVMARVPVFSALKEDEQLSGMPDLREPNCVNLLQQIDGVYEATSADLANGGLYWADMAAITRPWFLESIVRSPEAHQRVAQSAMLVLWN